MKTKMKSVAILQSNYIPWKGYFDLIHDVDEFIFYDEVQFTSHDWRNRNIVQTKDGLKWLTIPVGDHISRKISEVEINTDNWQRKHLATLTQSYSKSPFFKEYKDLLEYIYADNKWANLSELNQATIRLISKNYLNIKTEFSSCVNYKSDGDKSNKLVTILKNANANKYISGSAAKDYIDCSLFDKNKIEIIWKDYEGYPEYHQRFLPFSHNVSILDLLFNTGHDADWYIWGWRYNRTKRGVDCE